MKKPTPPRSCDVSVTFEYIKALEHYIKELEEYCKELTAARAEGLVTISEAAQMLGYDVRHIAKLYHAKRITGHSVGRHILLEKASVLAYQPIDARNAEGLIPIAKAILDK